MTGDQTGERAAKSCQRQFRGGLEPLHDTEASKGACPCPTGGHCYGCRNPTLGPLPRLESRRHRASRSYPLVPPPPVSDAVVMLSQKPAFAVDVVGLILVRRFARSRRAHHAVAERGHRVPVSRLPARINDLPGTLTARVDRQQRRVLELLRELRAPGPHHVQARSRRSILQVRRVVRCWPPAGGRPGAPVREGRARARADPRGLGSPT